MAKILQNGLENLETGEIIVSKSVHDYIVSYFPSNENLAIAVDGGDFYIRRAGNIELRDIKWRDISFNDQTPFPQMCDLLAWGTRGKTGKDPLKYVFLKDCEVSHLEAILKDYGLKMDNVYSLVIKQLIREKKDFIHIG